MGYMYHSFLIHSSFVCIFMPHIFTFTYSLHEMFFIILNSPLGKCLFRQSQDKYHHYCRTISDWFLSTCPIEILPFISAFLWHFVSSCFWDDAVMQSRSTDSRVRCLWVWVMNSLLMSGATLSNFLKLFMSQFPLL